MPSIGDNDRCSRTGPWRHSISLADIDEFFCGDNQANDKLLPLPEDDDVVDKRTLSIDLLCLLRQNFSSGGDLELVVFSTLQKKKAIVIQISKITCGK